MCEWNKLGVFVKMPQQSAEGFVFSREGRGEESSSHGDLITTFLFAFLLVVVVPCARVCVRVCIRACECESVFLHGGFDLLPPTMVSPHWVPVGRHNESPCYFCFLSHVANSSSSDTHTYARACKYDDFSEV